MAPTASQLDAMDLSPSANNDEKVTSNGYTRRMDFQKTIKTTNQADRPTGYDFFSTKVATHKSATRCNMPCQMVTCSATIIGGGTAGANITLDPETYYMKKEGKVWIEKNLTWNAG